MGLNELDLKYKYRSDYDSLFEDFYVKCLRESIKYDRASGYFTSGSLSVLAKGLIEFIDRESQIRIVCNPYISEKDYEAIRLGYKSKSDIITQNMLNELSLTEGTIENDPLNTLSWLIYMDKLDIKIAYTKNNSIYHEKLGIFYDENNIVAFSGSSNETIGGLVNNFEKIDVFYKTTEFERIQDMVNDFENLWCNKTEGLIVEDLPEKIKSYILSKKKGIKPQQKRETLKPREYQIDALKALEGNKWKGIFEMATGTGKTLTSIFCAQRFLEVNKKLFLVVMVPLNHLIDQWVDSLELLGFNSILKCHDYKERWKSNLEKKVRNFNIGLTNVECVIAVYDTASTYDFQHIISKIANMSFLIADECHNFGTNSFKVNKFDFFNAKLGLSATPERWWDEEGTNRIYDFFDRVVYEYDIQKAIDNGALVPYKYVPIVVGLSDEELESYVNYTHRIIRCLNSNSSEKDEEIKRLNRHRSLLISKAVEKKKVLYNILKSKDVSKLCHTLVYCAPSEIDEVTKIISQIGLKVHRFDSKIPNKERGTILEAFDRKDIQVLVAIKCLDEGVDIPSTKTAYFLASTSNPREFVQRRGRVLRKSKEKDVAEIYDFIVMPDTEDNNIFRNVVSKEMPRFAEFSMYSINKYLAREKVGEILEKYELEYLMDKLPWEVYHDMKEKFGR